MSHSWPWVALALLGAYHGLNPAMGWLFALAIGLQEKHRSAILVALLPIALGHAAAIAGTIFLFRFAEHFFSGNTLKWTTAAILFAVGIYRLFKTWHPRGAGMRMGKMQLQAWSFIMASAHGAGLMLIPVLLAQPSLPMHHVMHGAIVNGAPPSVGRIFLLAVLVHTAAMLVVAGVLALVFFQVYEKVGIGLLRHAWLNFDLLWAIALLVASFSVCLERV
jgi:hypothetical protein